MLKVRKLAMGMRRRVNMNIKDGCSYRLVAAEMNIF